MMQQFMKQHPYFQNFQNPQQSPENTFPSQFPQVGERTQPQMQQQAELNYMQRPPTLMGGSITPNTTFSGQGGPMQQPQQGNAAGGKGGMPGGMDFSQLSPQGQQFMQRHMSQHPAMQQYMEQQAQQQRETAMRMRERRQQGLGGLGGLGGGFARSMRPQQSSTNSLE